MSLVVCGGPTASVKPKIVPRKRALVLNTTQEEWTRNEERRLRQLAGTLQVREIARILTREFAVPRTKAAVNTRAKLLGLSLWWEGYSQNEVSAIFGVCTTTVAHWRSDGLLSAEPWEVGRGSRGQWHFSDESLIAFIDGCTWAYDLYTMAAGRWRRRAEVAQRADPYLTVYQLAAAWHVNPETVQRWGREGRIPTKRRLAGLGLPKLMFHAADLPGVRDEIREHGRANLRAGLKRGADERRRKAAAA